MTKERKEQKIYRIREMKVAGGLRLYLSKILAYDLSRELLYTTELKIFQVRE